jgi:hypothetical protein
VSGLVLGDGNETGKLAVRREHVLDAVGVGQLRGQLDGFGAARQLLGLAGQGTFERPLLERPQEPVRIVHDDLGQGLAFAAPLPKGDFSLHVRPVFRPLRICRRRYRQSASPAKLS